MFTEARRKQRCVRNSKTNFFLENEYAGTKQETEWFNLSRMIIIFTV